MLITFLTLSIALTGTDPAPGDLCLQRDDESAWAITDPVPEIQRLMDVLLDTHAEDTEHFYSRQQQVLYCRTRPDRVTTMVLERRRGRWEIIERDQIDCYGLSCLEIEALRDPPARN